MVRSLLVRGLLVGVLAGVVAFLVGTLVGELQVNRAIAFEEAHSSAAAPANPDAEQAANHEAGNAHNATDHTHDNEAVVSRTLQRGPGLLTATVGYGLAIGGLFALAYAGVVGRWGRLGHRASAALLALGGFVTVVLIPFLKYPANPPAVGGPDTINDRATFFFSFIVISVVCAVIAGRVGRAGAHRWGLWNGWVIGIGGYVAAIALVAGLMPVVNEVPDDFPATLLWDFRMASLTLQATLWTTLGLGFGYAVERRSVGRPSPLAPHNRQGN
jgi:predicted cobalt transporter CbtA